MTGIPKDIENNQVHEEAPVLECEIADPVCTSVMDAGVENDCEPIMSVIKSISRKSLLNEKANKVVEKEGYGIVIVLITIGLYLVGDIAKNILDRKAVHGTGINSAVLPCVYAFLNIILAAAATFYFEGKVGGKSLIQWSTLKLFAVPALFFAASQGIGLMVSLYLDAGVKKVLNQLRIPMTALVGRFVMGSSYTTLQWISMTAVLAACGCFHYLSQTPTSEADTSKDSGFVIGLCFLLLQNVFAVLGSLFAEKFLKSQKGVAFYKQKFQIEVWGFLCSLVMWIFITPIVIGNIFKLITGDAKFVKKGVTYNTVNVFVKKVVKDAKAPSMIVIENSEEVKFDKTLSKVNKDVTNFIKSMSKSTDLNGKNVSMVSNIDDLLTKLAAQYKNEKETEGETKKNIKAVAQHLQNLKNESITATYRAKLLQGKFSTPSSVESLPQEGVDPSYKESMYIKFNNSITDKKMSNYTNCVAEVAKFTMSEKVKSLKDMEFKLQHVNGENTTAIVEKKTSDCKAQRGSVDGVYKYDKTNQTFTMKVGQSKYVIKKDTGMHFEGKYAEETENEVVHASTELFKQLELSIDAQQKLWNSNSTINGKKVEVEGLNIHATLGLYAIGQVVKEKEIVAATEKDGKFVEDVAGGETFMDKPYSNSPFFGFKLMIGFSVLANLLQSWMSGMISKVLSSLMKNIFAAVATALIVVTEMVMGDKSCNPPMLFAILIVITTAVIFGQVPKAPKK